jgi:DNA invertase Pin-like site-specific DNA recombinase
MKRVAIYARVSTDKQTAENQILQLREVASKNGWEVVEMFIDEGISGAKGRDKRPAFDLLIKAATRRKFEIVMSWSVDRLGRSLQHLIDFLNELHAVGCDLYLHQQAIDTTTPSGKMMFQMCGVFAEFERSIIQQRVKAGLERAKGRGIKLGRPGLSEQIKRQIIQMRNSGLSLDNISKLFSISKSSAWKILRYNLLY